MPDILDQYREIIEVRLRQDVPGNESEVYKMLRYCMGWADKDGNPMDFTVGKLLRPSLCLFACESLGTPPERALHAAVTLELIHNFSLIHDEIQDFDQNRHHRPTLWTLWGVPKALIAGDVLKIMAESAFTNLPHFEPVANSIKCMSLVTEACLEMIEGQYLDINFEGRIDIGLEQYMNMISLKTGALIRCSVEVGANVATSGNFDITSKFRRSGIYLGYLFQITDDILGVWGLEEETGKSSGSDLKRKKNSLPIVYAMAAASKSSKSAIQRVYSKEELSDNDVQEILEILETSESRVYCQDLAEIYARKAINVIRDANIEPEKLKEYQDLCEYLTVRKF